MVDNTLRSFLRCAPLSLVKSWRLMNNTLLHARATARVLGLIVLFSLPACNGDSGGTDAVCEPGTERCPCSSDGNCFAGLTCLSNVCVQGAAGSGGTAGNPQGGSGRGNTGGTNSGGSNSGGASGSGTGGQVLTGGSGGVGGNTTGGTGGTGAVSGGSGGGTGGGSCGDTQTDPMNCGQCGRVCKVTAYDLTNADCPPINVENQCCSGGACVPYLGECLEQSHGFTTCEQYCGSVGESCVEAGCYTGNSTWVGWSDPEDCRMYAQIDSNISAACDSPLSFDNPNHRGIRCCCSDTQP
jgi:hypothetical protein